MFARFGVSGFCRTGNYGMPQFATNTMRLCTKDAAANAAYDASVPVAPVYYTNSSSYTTNPQFDSQEQCSESPYEVPWSTEDAAQAENPAATFAVGCVPMWDGSALSQNAKYPSDAYDSQMYNMDPGMPSSETTGWGEGCMDGKLLECTKDSDCVPIGGASLECKHGVCVIDTRKLVDLSSFKATTPPIDVYKLSSCYSHRDCQDASLMCSGDGRWVFYCSLIITHRRCMA